jgi:hypothetical protein
MSGQPVRRVLFICDLGPPFTGQHVRTTGVGGTESCIGLLAEVFATRGASVVVANRIPAAMVERAVRYVPLDVRRPVHGRRAHTPAHEAASGRPAGAVGGPGALPPVRRSCLL